MPASGNILSDESGKKMGNDSREAEHFQGKQHTSASLFIRNSSGAGEGRRDKDFIFLNIQGELT